LQEVWPRCLNLNIASGSRSQRTSYFTRFRGSGLQQTSYDGTLAVGSDTLTNHKTYVSYRNFTTLYYRLTTHMLQVSLLAILQLVIISRLCTWCHVQLTPWAHSMSVGLFTVNSISLRDQQISRHNCHSAAVSVRDNTLHSHEANKGLDVLLRQVWP